MQFAAESHEITHESKISPLLQETRQSYHSAEDYSKQLLVLSEYFHNFFL